MLPRNPPRPSRWLPLAAAALLALLAVPPSWADKGDCGQPISTGDAPTASDCGFILKTAVGVESCKECVCDVNKSNSLTTADALVCLKKAVGQAVTMTCPACPVPTTIAGVSTTSTSTTSTTTTLPVRCTDNADCSALPAEFRCNPNTGTCEKPCTRNLDCKDFYQCNKTTGYCEEPALLF